MLGEIEQAFLNNNINQGHSRETSGNSNISSEIKLQQHVWGCMAYLFTPLQFLHKLNDNTVCSNQLSAALRSIFQTL